eukprot:2500739-Pyramimonas_sp.AAC.1
MSLHHSRGSASALHRPSWAAAPPLFFPSSWPRSRVRASSLQRPATVCTLSGQQFDRLLHASPSNAREASPLATCRS